MRASVCFKFSDSLSLPLSSVPAGRAILDSEGNYKEIMATLFTDTVSAHDLAMEGETAIKSVVDGFRLKALSETTRPNKQRRDGACIRHCGCYRTSTHHCICTHTADMGCGSLLWIATGPEALGLSEGGLQEGALHHVRTTTSSCACMVLQFEVLLCSIS